jgi:hypothetical protein
MAWGDKYVYAYEESERLKVVSRRRSICKRAFQHRLALSNCFL